MLFRSIPFVMADTGLTEGTVQYQNVLKKKINLDVLDAKRREVNIKRNQARADKLKVSPRTVDFVPPEKIIMATRRRQRNNVRVGRISKNPARYNKETTALAKASVQVVLVVRIRGHNGITPTVARILTGLGLKGKNMATFVRANATLVKRLKLVEPYVTWGYPSRKTISDLLYKRGYVRAEGLRVAITDNVIVEKHFGSIGAICIEDLVHEIHNASDNLSKINESLWAFRLNAPLGGFPQKRIPFSKGGDSGLREEKINDLLEKMI